MAEKGMSRRKQALEPWRKTKRDISGHNIRLGVEHSERTNQGKKKRELRKSDGAQVIQTLTAGWAL